jgi:ABC-2 type transport system permease protein
MAWLRSTAAVAVLAAASYLLVYLVRLFAWPDWVTPLSFFGAYANPLPGTPPTQRPGLLAI